MDVNKENKSWSWHVRGQKKPRTRPVCPIVVPGLDQQFFLHAEAWEFNTKGSITSQAMIRSQPASSCDPILLCNRHDSLFALSRWIPFLAHQLIKLANQINIQVDWLFTIIQSKLPVMYLTVIVHVKIYLSCNVSHLTTKLYLTGHVKSYYVLYLLFDFLSFTS